MGFYGRAIIMVEKDSHFSHGAVIARECHIVGFNLALVRTRCIDFANSVLDDRNLRVYCVDLESPYYAPLKECLLRDYTEQFDGIFHEMMRRIPPLSQNERAALENSLIQFAENVLRGREDEPFIIEDNEECRLRALLYGVLHG